MNALFIFLCSYTFAFDMVGWYSTSSGMDPLMPPELFPWGLYSHMVYGKPHVDPDGRAWCNKTDVNLTRVLAQVRAHGRKLIWHPNVENTWEVMSNASLAKYKANYLATIGQAVRDCEIDGIEFDYECPNTTWGRAGIVTPAEATMFTQFMADIKAAMGPGKQISCDMGVWGVTYGSYPFMFVPWVNVSMVKNGAIDYINTMSYHYPGHAAEVFPWKKDGFILAELWGIPRNMINIGVPLFFHDGPDEVLWSRLAEKCPNLDPQSIECAGVRIVGKQENLEIGRWIREQGFRGAFPWAASYDTLQWNNTLAQWLFDGLQGR